MKLNPVLVSIIMGVTFMVSACGYSRSLDYKKFSSNNPQLGCTLDYISGWKYVEQTGSLGSYEQVVFHPELGKDTTSYAAIVLTVERTSPPNPANLDAFIKALLYKRAQFTDMQLVSDSKVKLCGVEGADIKLKYKKQKRLYSAGSELIAIQEKLIILEKDGKFYTLRYENEEAKFGEFINAFDHITGTLSVKK